MANFLEKASKKFKGERTLSTIIIIIFMVAFWVFTYTSLRWVFTAMTALIASLATYELIKSVKSENKALYAVSMLYSALEVFLLSYKVNIKWNVALTAYVLLVLILMIVMHEKTKYTDVAVALVGSVVYSYSFACFILIRDYYMINSSFTKQDCYFLFLMAFASSWLTDAGAFLVGRKFGKHKLCPRISPKKSVEGAVGGVVITVLLANFVYFLYDKVIAKIYGIPTFGGHAAKTYLALSLMIFVLSILSIFGDLAASVHKRKCGIKDYSNILPGHGGIMDRFDSPIFVLPAMYAIINMFNII